MITRGRHADASAQLNHWYDRVPAGALVRVEFPGWSCGCCARNYFGEVVSIGFLIVKRPTACELRRLLACARDLIRRRCLFVRATLRFFLEGAA